MKAAVQILCVGAFVLVGGVALSGAASTKGSPIPSDAASFNWTVSNGGRLHAIFNDNSAVARFVNAELGSGDVAASVGEFSLVGLTAESRLELICTIDYSGRGFFTHLMAFSERDGKIAISDISTNGANITDLKSRIVDLNHDGRYEILVPRLLEQYAGASPVATFIDVYTLNQGRLIESDQHFRGYYADTLLPRLHEELSQLQRTAATSESSALLRATKQKEIDAVEQMLEK